MCWDPRKSESRVIQSSMSYCPEGQLMVDSACAKLVCGITPRQAPRTVASKTALNFIDSSQNGRDPASNESNLALGNALLPSRSAQADPLARLWGSLDFCGESTCLGNHQQ